jgi:mxaJ protein
LSSGSHSVTLIAATAALLLASEAEGRELKVCADPNNLPFSNDRSEGFENKIAEIIAKDLNATLTYTWWAQRRGFVRNTLNAGLCDLVAGITLGTDLVRTSHPYYRSAYVFVTRADGPEISSLDDPILRNLKVGIQLVGNNGSNPPPAEALARRGIIDNVRGFTVYGDYQEPNPPADIMVAVAQRNIDVALVWGPLAGYFASREGVALRVSSVEPLIDGPLLPMAFDIAMGVRKTDLGLRDDVNEILSRRKPEIDRILAEYGVPRIDDVKQTAGAPP